MNAGFMPLLRIPTPAFVLSNSMTQKPVNPYHSPRSAPNAGHSSFVFLVLTTASILTGAVLLVLVSVIGPFAWILRDGLGPDATHSKGLQALTKMFWTFYWGPSSILAAIVCWESLILRCRLRYSAKNFDFKLME